MAQRKFEMQEPEFQPEQLTPSPDLKRLGDRLLGTWDLKGRESGTYGEIQGRVTFEWLEDGFFLVQHVDIDYIGRKIRGIEIIGHEVTATRVK